MGRLETFTIALSHSEFYRGAIYEAGVNDNGSLFLSDSDFQSTAGFYIWYPGSGFIERCRFLESDGFSVGVYTGTAFTISNNLFWRPRSTRYASAIIDNWARYGGSLTVTANSFHHGATEYVLRLSASEGANVGMDAGGNYWGTTDSATVQSLIYDRNDDLGAQNVIPVEPLLATPHEATPLPL